MACPGLSVGDEVVGFGTPGSDADLVVTSADRLVRKPADLSWELAGAVGAVGQTALTVLDGLRLPRAPRCSCTAVPAESAR